MVAGDSKYRRAVIVVGDARRRSRDLRTDFRVQRRRAIDLMQRFGGYRSGNTVLLNRLDLIRRLQEMAADPDIEQEHERKRRLSDHLVKLEKYRRAAAVQIYVFQPSI